MKIQSTDPKFPYQAQKLDIVIYPDPVLKKVAETVTKFDAELASLTQDMLKTMYHAPGIGLAAPQIGISKRLFVLDVEYEREAINEDEKQFELSNLNPQIFINPKLKNLEGETIYQEGCLSLPGVYDDVKRFKTLEVEYQDIKGNTHTIAADDLLSICIQHETDHLDGILFIEKLSHLKFDFYRNKLIKEKKRSQSSGEE